MELQLNTTLSQIRLREFRIGLRQVAVIGILMGLMFGCSRDRWTNNSTIEITGSRTIFLRGGIITPSPSGEFLVIITLTPAEERDGDRMVDALHGGHPVSFRIREEPSQPSILISDLTSRGEAIIRCKTFEEAQRVIDRLQSWPLQN